MLDRLPSEWANVVKAHLKAKKIISNVPYVIQMNAMPESSKVVLVNLGKKDTANEFRSLSGDIVRQFKKEAVVQWVGIDLMPDWEGHLSQVIPMSLYCIPHQKSEKETKSSVPRHVIISNQQSLISEGDIIGNAVNKARSFANSPANLLTTEQFVNDINALFKGDKRYTVTVSNEAQLKKKKMNALLGVGQGSKYPSYLVDITYKGPLVLLLELLEKV